MTAASRYESTRTSSSGRAGIADRPEGSDATQTTRERFHRPIGILSEHSAALVEARGLDLELCVGLGLETASDPGGSSDWVAIPYIRSGAVTHHKYKRMVKIDRDEGKVPHYSQDRGAKQYFWNYDCITDSTLSGQPLIVTEGEFDAIAALQAGFPRAVSVPNGAPEKELQNADGPKFSYVADTLDVLKDAQIVLATDNDGPGVLLMNELAMRLGKPRCRYVTYPDGCKDLNDVLRIHGTKAVVECINDAKWIRVEGLYRMSELPPAPEAFVHSIGIPGLCDHYLIREGDFTVITGIPGHGKSTLVNDIACRMAERYGWTVAFASPEQDPQEDHRRALRTWHGRMAARLQTPEQIAAADQWIDRHFLFICPDEDTDADLEWLLDTMAGAVIRHGAKLLVVDPWNELDHARPNGMSLTEYVGWAIRKLKKFAKKFRCHMIVVAHPAKLQRERGTNKPPVPTLYDISDSSAWFNKPDVGMIVHQDSGKTWVRIPKVRYRGVIGNPGKVHLRFDPNTMRFEAPFPELEGASA